MPLGARLQNVSGLARWHPIKSSVLLVVSSNDPFVVALAAAAY